VEETMNRSKTRELAFQLLYQAEIQKEVNDEDIEIFCNNNDINSMQAKSYINDVIDGVSRHKKNILLKISKNLKEDWEIDRISKVNLAILKLAIYEIEYKKLPYKVVINEVVELAKKYGEETSPSFINGILASIVKEG